MAVCEYCKKEFVPGHGSSGKYCSRECCKRYRAEYGFAAKRKDLPLVPCSYCGKLFRPRNEGKRSSAHRYCSRECSWNGLKRGTEAICQTCGKVFYSNDDHRLYCSKQCLMQWKRDKAEENRILRQNEAEEKKRQRIAEREAAREQARDREKERRRQYKKKKQEEARIARRHPCEVCGTITANPKYCCGACSEKSRNRRKEIARRHKLRDNGPVDYGISVEKLMEIYGGRCCLCGGRCNEKDFDLVDGTFIAGDSYPSIDHIIPVALGGVHQMSNVQLAHRICNARKSDTVAHETETGQLRLWV